MRSLAPRVLAARSLLVGLAGALLLSACGGDRAPTPAAAPAKPLDLAFAGCAQLTRDGHCALAAEGSLDVWIAGDRPDALAITLGTRAIDAASEASPRDGGWAWRLRPAAVPTTLRVEQPGAESFTLAIDPVPVWPWQEAAHHLVEAGRNDEAIDLLTEALATHPESERGFLLSRRARVHVRAGRWPRAEADFSAAIDAHARAGMISAQINDLTAVVFNVLNRHADLAAAANWLDRAPEPPRGDARGRILLATTRGFAARLAGELSAAEQFYRRALTLAARVGDASNEAAARVGLAQTLAEMGDFAHAADTLRATPEAALSTLLDCDRARLRNTRAWIELLAIEAGEPRGEPLPDLDAASDLLATHCAFLASDRANVELNRALAHVQRGDVTAARAALAAARALNAEPPPPQRAWMLEIEARIAMADGDPERALRAYRELDARSDALLMFDVQWRAALGAAEALHALGRVEDAIAELARGDRLLTDFVRDLPALDARALYLARYEALPRHWVEWLLEIDRVEDAWQVARRFRNEPLRRVQRLARIGALDAPAQARWRDLVSRYRRAREALDRDAVEDWQLSVAQLASARVARAQTREELRALVEQVAALGSDGDPPPPKLAAREGELSLLYFPLARGWVGFALDAQGLRARRIDDLDLAAAPLPLANTLLGPFREQLTRATRLRLMTYGPLRDLDFHRLDWDGQPLGARLSVVYAADLPPLAAIDARAEHVLLVADPGGDLPAARAEIAAIETRLREQAPAPAIERLQGEEAKAHAIVQALTRATLFHYAGHTADAPDALARIGLALAGDQRLELGDILMLEQAPRLAVLAACDSARADTRASAETLSLAHAFLARGAEDVIATTRPIDDAASARLTAALHDGRASGMPIDQALSEAQRRLRADRPDADWSAFRVYTR